MATYLQSHKLSNYNEQDIVGSAGEARTNTYATFSHWFLHTRFNWPTSSYIYEDYEDTKCYIEHRQGAMGDRNDSKRESWSLFYQLDFIIIYIYMHEVPLKLIQSIVGSSQQKVAKWLDKLLHIYIYIYREREREGGERERGRKRVTAIE